jgi:hypothetical protein
VKSAAAAVSDEQQDELQEEAGTVNSKERGNGAVRLYSLLIFNSPL